MTHSLWLVPPVTQYRPGELHFADLSPKLFNWEFGVKGWGVSQLEDTSSSRLLVWKGLRLVWKWKSLTYCPKPAACGNTTHGCCLAAVWIAPAARHPIPGHAGSPRRVTVLCFCLCLYWKPLLRPSSSSATSLMPPLGIRTRMPRTVWFWTYKQTRGLLNPTVYRRVCWKHACWRLKA